MHELTMEIRRADTSTRTIEGVVVPYDEISYLVPYANGERVMRGAFSRSLKGREGKIPLFANHEHSKQMGTSTSFTDTATGLIGRFKVNNGKLGDELLQEARDGYWSGMSVGFRTIDARKGSDGVREVHDAHLIEVSMVGIGAYEGATLVAVRRAQQVDAAMAPFRNLPKWNLGPHSTFRRSR